MNYINRNNDVILNNNDLEKLYTFKNFPVFMGCVETDAKDDVKADMSWSISKKSGAVQLNPLLPLEVVYPLEHGSGTIGKIWEEHHLEFSKFVQKYNPNQVLEIGGLHGILAKNCLKFNPNLDWTIIEPNPTIDSDIKVKVIKSFFDSNFKSNKKFDTVIHSHVLEHVYNPKEFFQNKSSLMDEGSNLIFSIPNMEVMLKNKYTNCINFEHTIYFTTPYIEYFLKKYGFKILEKKYFRDDHSIFYSAKKVNPTNKYISIDSSLYDKNKNMFNEYINFYLNDVKNINSQLSNFNIPVYLFGAHIFSQYLISFGLDTSKLVCLLDNDPHKKDKRLYGTNLISKTPKVLEYVVNAVVILRAGVYNEEIKNDILNNINPNIQFI